MFFSTYVGQYRSITCNTTIRGVRLYLRWFLEGFEKPEVEMEYQKWICIICVIEMSGSMFGTMPEVVQRFKSWWNPVPYIMFNVSAILIHDTLLTNFQSINRCCDQWSAVVRDSTTTTLKHDRPLQLINSVKLPVVVDSLVAPEWPPIQNCVIHSI